jgi:hypothetical protein
MQAKKALHSILMGEKPKKIVVATSNQGKAREYGELLQSLPV